MVFATHSAIEAYEVLHFTIHRAYSFLPFLSMSTSIHTHVHSTSFRLSLMLLMLLLMMPMMNNDDRGRDDADDARHDEVCSAPLGSSRAWSA